MRRSDAGDWYFLALKAFKLKTEAVAPTLSLFTEQQDHVRKLSSIPQLRTRFKTRDREYYEKMATCKLCQTAFPPDQVSHKLTMKMLVQAEKQLRVPCLHDQSHIAPGGATGLAEFRRVRGLRHAGTVPAAQDLRELFRALQGPRGAPRIGARARLAAWRH